MEPNLKKTKEELTIAPSTYNYALNGNEMDTADSVSDVGFIVHSEGASVV